MKIPSLEDLMLAEDMDVQPSVFSDDMICDCCERVIQLGEKLLDYKGVVLCESCIDGLMSRR